MPLGAQTLPDLYDAHVPDTGGPASGRIHPFVGAAYTTDSAAMRVMAMGINAYCDDNAVSQSGWFPAMFAAQKYHFQRRVLTEVSILARGLSALPRYADRPFLGIPSILHTNAVKRWIPYSKGRYAHRVPEALLDEGGGVFRAELDALATGGVLPDLVVMFGARPWRYVWTAFARPRPGWVTDFRPMAGELHGTLDRVTVCEAGEERPLLLVRLRHPTGARGKGMTAKKLLAHPDFRAAVGLP